MSATLCRPPLRCSLKDIESAIHPADGRHRACFGGMGIDSRFQPILSVPHQRIAGHEALMRSAMANGDAIPPLDAFGRARDLSETVFLDRLTRALHLRNFIAQDNGGGWLFLNVNPRVAVGRETHGRFFEELLKKSGLPSRRVVIEIIESAFDDHARLADAVEFYRSLGCLIAIDDFGAGHSNFDRIWRTQPDIVKLDRSMLEHAVDDPAVRRIMPGVVKLLHEAGSLVLMEGIETRDEALIALNSDVDFVQGYYFGHPMPSLTQSGEPDAALAALLKAFRRTYLEDTERYRAELARYSRAMEKVAALVELGIPLAQACAGFLQMPRAEYCYLLNADGAQVGDNVVAPDARTLARHMPLAESRGSIWFHRQYFRHAIAHPHEVQITGPYLSITGMRNCITFSLTLRRHGQPHVVCGDIKWEHGE